MGKNGITGLIFSVSERFLRSWVNNLMVLKKAVLLPGSMINGSRYVDLLKDKLKNTCKYSSVQAGLEIGQT